MICVDLRCERDAASADRLLDTKRVATQLCSIHEHLRAVHKASLSAATVRLWCLCRNRTQECRDQRALAHIEAHLPTTQRGWMQVTTRPHNEPLCARRASRVVAFVVAGVLTPRIAVMVREFNGGAAHVHVRLVCIDVVNVVRAVNVVNVVNVVNPAEPRLTARAAQSFFSISS